MDKGQENHSSGCRARHCHNFMYFLINMIPSSVLLFMEYKSIGRLLLNTWSWTSQRWPHILEPQVLIHVAPARQCIHGSIQAPYVPVVQFPAMLSPCMTCIILWHFTCNCTLNFRKHLGKSLHIFYIYSITLSISLCMILHVKTKALHIHVHIWHNNIRYGR